MALGFTFQQRMTRGVGVHGRGQNTLWGGVHGRGQDAVWDFPDIAEQEFHVETSPDTNPSPR